MIESSLSLSLCLRVRRGRAVFALSLSLYFLSFTASMATQPAGAQVLEKVRMIPM